MPDEYVIVREQRRAGDLWPMLRTALKQQNEPAGDALSHKLDHLRHCLAELEKRLPNLAGEIEQHACRLDRLEIVLVQQEGRIDQLSGMSASACADPVTSVETPCGQDAASDSNTSRVADLEAVTGELLTAVRAMQTGLEAVDAKTERNIERVCEVVRAGHQGRERLDLIEARICGLEDRLTEAAATCQPIIGDVAALTKKVDDHGARLHAIGPELVTVAQCVDRLTARLDALQTASRSASTTPPVEKPVAPHKPVPPK